MTKAEKELEKEKALFREYRKMIVKQFKFDYEMTVIAKIGNDIQEENLRKGWIKFLWITSIVSIVISSFNFYAPVVNCG